MSMMSTAKTRASQAAEEARALGRQVEDQTRQLAEAAKERGSELAHSASEGLQQAGQVVRRHPVVSSAVVAAALFAIGGYLLARRR